MPFLANGSYQCVSVPYIIMYIYIYILYIYIYLYNSALCMQTNNDRRKEEGCRSNGTHNYLTSTDVDSLLLPRQGKQNKATETETQESQGGNEQLAPPELLRADDDIANIIKV